MTARPPRSDHEARRRRTRPRHGHVRRSDRPGRTVAPPPPAPPRPPRALLPSVLVLFCVGLGLGWIHIETKTREIDVAARTARAMEIHTRHAERLRVLEAERAYLRRPDRIRDVAIGRLGLVPPPPEKVHEIVVRKAPP